MDKRLKKYSTSIDKKNPKVEQKHLKDESEEHDGDGYDGFVDPKDEDLEKPIPDLETKFLSKDLRGESGDTLPAATSEYSDSADDPIYSRFVQELPSDDEDFEGVLCPDRVFISNVHPKATKADVRKFFVETRITKIVLFKSKVERTMSGIVTFKHLTDTQKAIDKNGELMHVESETTKPYHIYVSPCQNDSCTLFVSGFDEGLDREMIENQLRGIFGCYSDQIKIYLPPDLRFAYLYLVDVKEPDEQIPLPDVLENGSIQREEVSIYVRVAKLKKEFAKGWV